MRVNDRDHYNNIKDSITMNNLKKIIKKKEYLMAKVAMNSIKDTVYQKHDYIKIV